MNKQEKNMDSSKITERDLKVIDEIAKNQSVTQREISRRAGMSLGMVNIVLKRLTKKGYVKLRKLNKRSLEYILTPKGFAEKAKKSYWYVRRTIDSLKQIKVKIQILILKEYQKGEREFIILGDSELADIVEISLRDLRKGDLRYTRVSEKENIKPRDVLILAAGEKHKASKNNKRWINVLEKIAS